MQDKYDHKKIEKKWQKEWAEKKLHETKDKVEGKENFYTLVEFPYPSGNLHIGHWYAFSIPDIFVRAKRMQGYNVLFPIGFDAFGLPAENAAIKRNLDPKKWTYENIAHMEKQLESMGASFDWTRKVVTADPEYYKWTQWLFLQFYKNGLAYKKKALVNWCPKDQTVLANEQVVNGKCERCGTEVVQKDLEQWFFKITNYAEKLLTDLEPLNWPEPIKDAQRNWIGKSEGAEIEFPINLTPNPLPEGKGAAFGYHTTDPSTWRALQDRAIEMRENPTEAEKIVWQSLKADKVGYHFRRQHIIGRFIVDFVCLEKKLVIEIDGDIHDYQKTEDEERTAFLNESGFKVIRFRNEEAINDPNKVRGKITDVLKALPFGEGLGGVVRVFTTRPDTLYGATYIVLAPEHPMIERFKDLKIENWQEIQNYINQTKQKTEIERTDAKKEKTGVEIEGIKAINPATGDKIAIWVADYVLGNYGTGAVMAVPMHDERDFQFAKKYGLPMKEVVIPRMPDPTNPHQEGKEIVFRNAIIAVIRNPKTSKYLCLKWKKHPWVTFVMGGMEEGEDAIDSAIREIQEETGYKNIKFVKDLGKAQSEFFAAHKDVNRIAHTRNLLFELENEEKEEISKEEQEIHELEWRTEEGIRADDMTHSEMSLILKGLEQDREAFTDDGVLFDSGEFTRMDSVSAREKIADKFGKKVTKYKLRDWLLSRQRYWGAPIPIVYDPEGTPHPIGEEHLPWLLPEDNIDFTPKGTSPLGSSNELKERVETIFGKGWAPEYDTMDTFVDSSWYFLRYTDPKNEKEFASKEHMNAWMPVARYSGGAEHTTMHVLYSRFFQKALFDMGLVKDPEPYTERMNRGLILGPDGQKMSKSKGNVIDPDEQVEKVGADTVRMYLAFIGPYNEPGQYPWDIGGIVGVKRFLERVWRIAQKSEILSPKSETNSKIENILNKTIKKVSEDIAVFKFNTAISSMMIFINELDTNTRIGPNDTNILETFLKLLAPFAPHIAEEIWYSLGHTTSIHLEEWPKFDESKIKEEKVVIVVQINGKVRAQFESESGISEDIAKEKAFSLPDVTKWLEGKELEKVIFVPDKLLNIVAN